jgi:hypothetical protein
MNKTYIWWRLLCAVSIFNIMIWVWVLSQQSTLGLVTSMQAGLSAVYVAVCAFRSFYLRIDLERICLYDTPLSSIFLGRICATVAEICFSMQCAIFIYSLGVFIESNWVVYLAYTIVPTIILAQVFCWYATLTLNHFWHGLEEVTWVVMITLALTCLINGYIIFENNSDKQVIMLIGIYACLGSLYIMVFVDIPMYLKRVIQGRTDGLKYLTVNQGIQDAWQRRVQTSDWAIWKKEILWITSYFTLGVWLSIAMILVKF